MHILSIGVACVALHVSPLGLLAIRRRTQTPYDAPYNPIWLRVLPFFIKVSAGMAAVITLELPSLVNDAPLLQCGLRVVCFFYACKILDLGVARADTPPTRLLPNGNPASMQTTADLALYAWLLLTEMRYLSFDIAIKQSSRIARDITLPFAASFILGILDYGFLQLPEVKCICLLLLLQGLFESLHLLLHPGCARPLFYKPWRAGTMSDFWSVHWHTAAAPFIQTLAYRPGKRYVGQWFGILAAFNLTGIWHGWATAALAEDGYAFAIGLRVWALFMMMGVLCLLERWTWDEKQGGMLQRIVVWTLSIGAAGQCFRYLQSHTTVPALRRPTER